MPAAGSPPLETRLCALNMGENMTSTKEIPRLLQLPREIRDHIYRYVVYTSRGWLPLCILERSSSISLDSEDNREIRRMISPMAIPFMYTCRQILHEASVVFYRENYFHFVPTPGHYLPAAFAQESLLRSTRNIRRIKHLRLTLPIGRLDSEQDEVEEERSKEGKTILVRKATARQQRSLARRWLKASAIPKILQAFKDQRIGLTTLEMRLYFFYRGRTETETYDKALCDEFRSNFDMVQALYDLNVRGQTTICLRSCKKEVEVYPSVRAYARHVAYHGRCNIVQAQSLANGEFESVWYVTPEKYEDKLAQIRKSLRDGEHEPVMTYCIQVG